MYWHRAWMTRLWVLYLGGTALVLAEQPSSWDPISARAGWIRLFDGQSLYGWTALGDAQWTVSEGVLAPEPNKSGFLRSDGVFGDFELRLEFRATPHTNSGVFIRSCAEPRDPLRDCYEINIAPASNPYPTGSVVARHCRHGVGYVDDWRTMEVEALGDTISVIIDGQEAMAYRDPDPLRAGHILLQGKDGPVEFRNIHLRPRKMEPIPIREGLPGWNVNLPPDGQVTADEGGSLQIAGGPGFIELPIQLSDFILQMECRTEKPGVNSGVFVRCIPGAPLMGYESQIHHGFSGDPSKPSQGGTGAIFRRCDARRIVTGDGEWFTKTILATGAHFAVWVNGYQVSNWTDGRLPHENPRTGRRLEAGSIMLQAHDRETAIRFRNFRVQSLDFP